MRPVIVGGGDSGSWAIRGLQMSEATGFPVRAPTERISGYDVVIVVKRAIRQLIRWPGQKLVWDIVDAWPQPSGNSWSRVESLAWLKMQLDTYKPDLTIAATQRMAEDIQAFGYRAVCIVHHSRPYPVVSVRADLRTVIYEGSEQHLGTWAKVLHELGKEQGFQFIINPLHYWVADVVVGLRQPEGYPARCWKSNVKQANAQASGLPFIGSPECGYKETGSGREIYVTDRAELKAALEYLRPVKTRLEIAEAMVAVAPRLEKVAEDYVKAVQHAFDTGL